jgi:hypothetical protein
VLTKPSPLGKKHTVVKTPWLIIYWVIDKDTHVKVLPTPLTSMVSSSKLRNANSESDIASHWLPTAATLTIMDPTQPEPVMKIPISIEHDYMQYHTSVLIDSTTTLNFASQNFLTRNDLLGECIRGPKIVIRIANEQRILTNKTFSPTNVSLGQKKITCLNFKVLPHLKGADFIFGLLAMNGLNMSIQLSKDLVLIGDIPF